MKFVDASTPVRPARRARSMSKSNQVSTRSFKSLQQTLDSAQQQRWHRVSKRKIAVVEEEWEEREPRRAGWTPWRAAIADAESEPESESGWELEGGSSSAWKPMSATP